MPRLPNAIAELMGLLPGHPDAFDHPKDPLFVWGYVRRGGPYLSVFLTLPQIDVDLPALAEWVYAKGCSDLTYECQLSTTAAVEEDPVD